MTGQEATNVAKGFNERLGITGVILTKMDGDARGGAALSIFQVTGAPIKFVGDRREAQRARAVLSRPARLAHPRDGRRADADREDAERLLRSDKRASSRQKLRKNEFTLDDFLDQLRQVRKMGSMSEIMKMIPGLSQRAAQRRNRRARRCARRGDHLLDDAARARASRRSSTPRAASASRSAAARRSPTSTGSSSSSKLRGR